MADVEHLCDFLANKKGHKENLLAQHIIEDYEPRPGAMEYIEDNRIRIHRLLAHISKERPNLPRPWRLDLFMKELTAEWAHFRAVLKQKHPDIHQVFVNQTNTTKFRLQDAEATGLRPLCQHP